MSRTKHKWLRLFIACGNNTDYYRKRRRKVRNRNRQMIRNLKANYDVDEMNDRIYNFKLPKEDQWNEPTDGHYAIDKADRERFSRRSDRWFNAKIKSKLKR